MRPYRLIFYFFKCYLDPLHTLSGPGSEGLFAMVSNRSAALRQIKSLG